MIDLHMHTKYSDGTDTLKELLTKCNEKNLEIISITDHNSCKSYYEMERFNYKDLYKGNIIVGCEFTTSYKGKLIELLGYDFDYKKVEEYLNNYYTEERYQYNCLSIYNSFMNRIKEIGFNYEIKDMSNKKFTSEFFERSIYNKIIKDEKNKEKLNEDVWANFGDFYRKGLTNPKSKLYINYGLYKPTIKDIINLVHNNGGKIFLAHPYQYKLDNTIEFINNLFDEYDIDGIECFYTLFSKEETNNIKEFACSRNLLVSGGSDYHGTRKENHELGIGRGNLYIDKNILDNWNIKYYK